MQIYLINPFSKLSLSGLKKTTELPHTTNV